MEPSPRCRPGSPALQGQGHSRVRRQGTGASDGGRFRFTDQRGLRAYAGAGCPRRESDPHCAISTLRLLPNLGYEDVKPLPGADPGHPPYQGGAAAVRGGVSWGIKIRT